MAAFRADPESLSSLAAAVRGNADEVGHWALAGAGVLTAFDCHDAAAALASELAAAVSWARTWHESLRSRVAILEGDGAVPTGAGTVRALLAAATSVYSVHVATPAPADHLSLRAERLAHDLLDGLERGQLDAVEAIIARLAGLTEDDLVAFFDHLGVDLVGLFPRLVAAAGVNAAQLDRYLAPMGRALGIASRAGDGMSLPFTGAELMDGRGDGAISPAAYFDFGHFSPDFLAAAAAGVLAGFDASDLPLRGPDYTLEDGTAAGPDPRLPLLRAVREMATDTQRHFLAHLAVQGLLPGLLAPATPWYDGGEAAGALLRCLVTASDGATMGTTAEVMRVAAEARGVSPAVALGAASAVAPHLASLVLSPWFGPGSVTLQQTPLRPALDALPDASGIVQGFLASVLVHTEAAATLHTAFSALLAATVAAHLDPQDADSLAPVSDDLGLLWGALFGPGLQVDLDRARRLDANVGIVAGAVGLAAGYLLTGGAAAITSSGFAGWATEAMTGVGLAVAPVDALLGGTGAAEGVLLDGFDAIRDAETAAAALLAAEMHRRGVVELPPALLDEEGHMRLGGPAGRALLADSFHAAGIDPTTWFNDIMAIFAYGIPDPY